MLRDPVHCRRGLALHRRSREGCEAILREINKLSLKRRAIHGKALWGSRIPRTRRPAASAHVSLRCSAATHESIPVRLGQGAACGEIPSPRAARERRWFDGYFLAYTLATWEID